MVETFSTFPPVLFDQQRIHTSTRKYVSTRRRMLPWTSVYCPGVVLDGPGVVLSGPGVVLDGPTVVLGGPDPGFFLFVGFAERALVKWNTGRITIHSRRL